MKRLYGIAGNGRASRHLQRYLRLLKTPYKLWHRRLGSLPEDTLAPCTTVFLLLKDSAIAPFMAANRFLRGKQLIHFSGSLRVPGAAAMHPFMPLASRPLSLSRYKTIPFALEPGVSLKNLVPELPNPSFTVRPAHKARYHSLCAMGANLPVLLWEKVSGELSERFGVSRQAVLDYFMASLENFIEDPPGALSGPIARGDAGTVSSDIAALGRDPYAGVYSAFARAYKASEHNMHCCGRGARVSKTVSEGEACVSAEPETRKRAHGVRDAGFAFRAPRQQFHKNRPSCTR